MSICVCACASMYTIKHVHHSTKRIIDNTIQNYDFFILLECISKSFLIYYFMFLSKSMIMIILSEYLLKDILLFLMDTICHV